MRIIHEMQQQVSQAEFALLTDRSAARVSQWAAEGTLRPGGTALEWLHAVINRLATEAAGRASDGPLDLSQERAALARSARELNEQKLSVLRGEFASISLLADVLATASQAVAERFDHLPGTLKRACPDLPAEAVAQVLGVIATARNEWARGTAELVQRRLTEDEDDEPTDDDEAAAEPAA